MEQTPAIQTHMSEGALEKNGGTLGEHIPKEGLGIPEMINQHGLASSFGEHSDLKKNPEDNEDTVLKNLIPGRYEDELSDAETEEKKGNVEKNLVDGFDVGWSSG